MTLLALLAILPVVGGSRRGLAVGNAPQAKLDMPAYSVDSTWPPPLPNGWVLGDASAVAVDRHDHVYILHRPRTVPPEKKDHAAPSVVEFDASGKFANAWGGPGAGYDWPDTEHGITVDYKD